MGLPFHLNGLHFGLEDHVPTRIYEELATIGKSRSGVMTSLTLPQIPPMFVPLILANHGNIRGETYQMVLFRAHDKSGKQRQT